MAENLDKDDWQDLLIGSMTGGIITSQRPDALEDDQLVDAENVWFDRALVRVDTGYITFNQVVRGIPRITFQFFKTNGTDELLCITDATLYVSLSDEWQYVSDGTADTLAANGSGGQTSLTTAAAATFTANDFIGIALDSGKQHRTTVVSHIGTTLVIGDALPGSGVVATSGNAVVKAVDLTGSANIPVSVVVVPSVDWFVFTNGVDNVQKYDGTSVGDVPNLPSGGNTQCRVVALFANHLLLLNTVEGGTNFPQRVRRADTGDPTNWTTGNAGRSDLLDSEDHIVAAAPLGPYMIVYKERTIIRQEFIGSDDVLFNFDTMIQGEGALAQDAVSDLGDFHIFAGNSNIYIYRGGFDMEPVGDEIYYKVFGITGDINPSYRTRTFMIYVEELDEIWLVYPKGASMIPDTILRYKLSTKAWAPRALTHKMWGFGFFQTTASVTWTTATGVWTDYTYAWNAQRITSNAAITHLCGDSPTQVYSYNYIAPTDDGATLSYHLDTKDFTDPGYELRVDWLELHIMGGAVTIDYSTDEGQSWTQYEVIPSALSIRTYRAFGDAGQFITRKVRWRLSGVGNGFSLAWINMHYKRETKQ